MVENTNSNVEQENEISLLDLWNKIWKNKFLIIIIVGAITALGIVALFFANKSGRVVQSNFNYEFINVGRNEFADGTVFDYRRLLDVEFLEKVKASSADFKDVNVEKLSKDSNAKFVLTEEKDKDDKVTKRYYTIELPNKYFGNDRELNEQFIQAIHNNLLQYAKSTNAKLGVYNYFQSAKLYEAVSGQSYKDLTFNELVSIVKSQHALITQGYENLGNSQVNDQRFDDMRREYMFWYQYTMQIGTLETEIKQKTYYNNAEKTRKNAEYRITVLEKEKTINQLILDDLEKQYAKLVSGGGIISGSNPLLDEITLRTKEAILIKDELDQLGKLINIPDEPTAANKAFTENFFELTEQLSIHVEEFNKMYFEKLDFDTRYTIIGDYEFEVVNPFNLILMTIVVAMISGIGAVTYVLIKESANDKKQEEENTKLHN